MDITDKAVVSQLLNEIELDSNVTRKRREYKAFRILEGDLDYYVAKRNSQIFPETHSYLRISQVDISGRVVRKLAASYNTPPQRILSEEGDTEVYRDMLSDTNLDEALLELDYHYHNNHEAGLWVTFDQEAETPFYFRTLKSFEYDRVVNQRGETEVVILSFPTDEVTDNVYGDHINSMIQDEHEDTGEERQYALWTADQHVMVKRASKDKDTFIELEGNENNENPLGFLPFFFVQKSRSTYQQPTNTLSERSVEWNSQNSIVNSYLDLIYGTWVLSHDDSQELDVLRQGLYSFVRLPQRADGATTTLTHESPSPDINAAREVLKDQLMAILEDHGISSGSGVGGQTFSSALERMIANADVSQHIKRMQRRYVAMEKHVYRTVSEFMSQSGMGDIGGEELLVVFPEHKPIQTDQEKISNTVTLLDNQLISKVDALMRIEPNINREEAERMVEDASQENTSQFFTGRLPGNEEGSEE